MRKLITASRLLAFFLFFNGLLVRLSAQISNDDSSFNNQMNNIFANLNKNNVPFGILQDYAMEFTNLAAYNGLVLADSTKTTYMTVSDIYNTLASGAISTNVGNMVAPLAFDSIWQSQRQAGVITLAGVFYQYASFVPNAVNNGLITVSNNQVYDAYVNGVWQNPYQTQNVFAVSPSIDAYNSYGTHSVQVVLPASTWLTNSSTLISSMTVDFADGSGARTLTLGQTYNLSYSTGGTKTWNFTLNLTNGAVLQSRTDFLMDSLPQIAFNFFPGRSGSLVGAPQRSKWTLPSGGYTGNPMPITATTAMYGQYARGYMTISYANSDQKLRNPLIIAEGFDPGDVLKPEQLTGEQTLQDFLNQVWDSTGNSNLYSLLVSGSYDIIYVDWQHGTDFIERNAMLLEAVIDSVNKLKITTNPNIIIGQSMGGLVTRYALKDMENKGVNHQTSLFINWDGPQQGANVPLAYQYMSRQARSLYIKSPLSGIFAIYSVIHSLLNGYSTTIFNLRQLYAGSPYASYYPNVWVGDPASGALYLQDFPAAREMLINFLNTAPALDNSIHTQWQSSLSQMGYPQGFSGQPCKLVAVSNGSECAGTEPYSPGQAMFDIRGNASTSFLGDILGTFVFPIAGALLAQPSLFLSILPGSNQFAARFSCYAQPNQTTAQQYVGSISYTKKVLWVIPVTNYWTNWNVNSNPSILPYDYFPGGKYTASVALQSQQWNLGIAKFGITVNADLLTFDFVPVPSALDIGLGTTALTLSDYLTPYVGAFPPGTPKNTPFSSFITAYNTYPNSNEDHIEASKHNAPWVYDQIVGTPIVDNCSFLCVNNVTIAGPTKLCTGSQVYSLTGISTPNDAQVTWSASPSFVTVTGNGTQATVTRTGNGTVTLTAVISSASCGTTITENLSIQVGAPTVSLQGTPGSCSGTTQYWTLAATPSNLGTNWNWSVGYVGSGSTIYIYSPSWSSTQISVTGGGIVNLNYTDNCGNPESNSITVYSSCHGYGPALSVSPNPSTGVVTLSASSTGVVTNSDATKAVTSTGATATTPAPSGQTATMRIYQVNVYAVTGTLLKQFSYPAGGSTVKLDLTSLTNGTYILQVYDGKSWTSQQVVILK